VRLHKMKGNRGADGGLRFGFSGGLPDIQEAAFGSTTALCFHFLYTGLAIVVNDSA
jgi:hypothetical protein